MKSCPMTKRPSGVALLVATKEEQRSLAVTAGSVSSSARRKLFPVMAVGDPLHLLEVLGVVAAQHERVGQAAQAVPALLRIALVLQRGELLEVAGQLGGDEL